MQKLIATVLSAALLTPATTFAQEAHNERVEAEQHYQTAVVLLSEGRYLEALSEFDAAIALSPQAIFFCNRALVQVKLDETAEAVKSLRSCRDMFEGDETELAQIDAQYLGLVTYDEVVRPHAMTVARDIATGPVPVAGNEAPWNISDVGLITMGVGAALLASAATVDLMSAQLKEDYIAESQGGAGTSLERYNTLRDDVEFRQNLFWGLGGAGALLLVAGGGMVAYHFATDETTVTVRPALGFDGLGVQLVKNF